MPIRPRSGNAAVLLALFSGCTQLEGLNDYRIVHGGSGEPPADADLGIPPEMDASEGPPADSAVQPETVRPETYDGSDVVLGDNDARVALDGGPSSSGDADGRTEDVVVNDAEVPPDGAPTCLPPLRRCGQRCTLLDDPKHCGKCDHDCTALPNVSGPVSCRADGVCEVPASACARGFAHCSSDPDDGCEADIAQPSRCGTCNQSCSTALPLCASSQDAGAGYACVSGCGGASPTKCGSSCVNTDESLAHCGGCFQACPASTNGTATCSGGKCGLLCNHDHHRCGNQCVPNAAVTSCGSSCTPCAAPENAAATCDAGITCDFVCSSNYHRCGNTCARNDSVTQCGASCVTCRKPSNGSALCMGGSCSFKCDPGFQYDGSNCVDLCPNDPAKTIPGVCGCGLSDTSDRDGDGTVDCLDQCPDDPIKTKPGACGCGVLQC